MTLQSSDVQNFYFEICIMPLWKFITMSKWQYWSVEAQIVLFVMVLQFTAIMCFKMHIVLNFTNYFNLCTHKVKKQELFNYLHFHSLKTTLARTNVSKHICFSADHEVLVGSCMFHLLVSSLPGASNVPEDSYEIHGKILAVLTEGGVQAFPVNINIQNN